MTDSEQLVQRFVDQELSADERVQVVARLGRDESLRQRAIELEQLAIDASRLPRPAVPDDFVMRVMERVMPPGPAPSIRRRLADTLFAPRNLRWNLASAVAGLALLVVGAVVAGRLAIPPAPPAVTADPSTVLVRLVVLQPGARTVEVAGDFNEWNPARTSLERISDGAWAVTIPLKPGRYEYMFVVDGQQWIAAPFATERSDDGFGSLNAVLEVRPPLGAQS